MSFIQSLQGLFSLPAIEAAAWGCATCFLISVLLVLTKKLHGSATMDMSHGVQKFHTAPTPRVAIILAACVWGFFWVNWPFGKLFLGDGGSYFVGFALAWVAVLLIERNPSVSPFAALLICIHPVSEVLLSIFRRKLKKLNPGHPDRLHFHSLIKQRYVRRWFGHLSFELRNSITGVLVGFMTLTAILIALVVNQSSLLSLLAVITLSMGYVAIYARIVRFQWCSPILFLMSQPKLRRAN